MKPAFVMSMVAMCCAMAAAAQPSTPLPMSTGSSAPPADDAGSMHMTPEEMRQMQSFRPAAESPKETHAPDPSLQRSAASEHVALPMMAGMDTDMDDATVNHRVWLENLEGIDGTHDGGAWDAQAWVGGDIEKLLIKSEGATLASKTRDSKIEALWAHAVLPFWDTQLGMRYDFSGGPNRKWAAFGVQGISPYWFDTELTGYLGEEGRTAVRLKTEYDLYLSERLILEPEMELNAYGKPDHARNIGAGLSGGQWELRLRYEISRRFAPYVGYVYDRKFAGTAERVRLAGDPAIDHRAVAGVDLFF